MRILLVALVGAALLFAGCTGDDSSGTDSADSVDPAPDLGDFVPTNYTYEGTAFAVATVCFQNEEQGPFEEDVGGWKYEFSADRAGPYVVWQDSAGENMDTADQGEGRVPGGAANFYVCPEITDPVMEASYSLVITEPLPDADEPDEHAEH